MVFAKSKAGHDKDEVYYVYAEEDEDVILVNGRNRTIEYPKKKRKKHVQPIARVSEEVRRILDEPAVLNDDVVRRAIRKYQEEMVCQKQMSSK